MVCDDDEAPRVNFESNSVRTLCTLTTDLSQVPSHFWTQKVNSMGGKYQSLGFTLGVRVESGGLRFDLRVGNLTYGEVTASFN